MPERRFGPFIVEEKLGAGAMGVVYRARHAETGQRVALKILPPGVSDNPRLVARFDREINILKRMRHPNIVQCFDGGRLGEHRFFTMELVTGGSLADLLKRRGRLTWEQTIQFGLQICAALDHAHQHAIVHRDLKPSNLLLSRDGSLKLADFGLARDVDATGLTAPGRTVGTFAYMAPEQIAGKPPISHKTDLYALGCVLFEMLAGRPPFLEETPGEIFYQHLQVPAPRVATVALDCPIWLDALIDHLLEKEPAKRPLDALAVTQALQEVEQNVHLSTVQHSLTGRPSTIASVHDTAQARKLVAMSAKKRKRAKAGPFYQRTWFLAGCLAVVAALVIWTFWPKSERWLFEHAVELMAGDDPLQWQTARDKYLDPLQRRFPNGQHAEQVQQFIDKIEMYEAERRYHANRKLGRDPKSEAERLYANAMKFEQFGDRVSALEQYRSMVNLLKDRPEDRAFLNLARRQAAKIEEAGGDKEDRLQIVTAALDRADKLYEQGQVLEARQLWTSIIHLYSGNREMDPLVERASQRLTQPKERESADQPPAESDK